MMNKQLTPLEMEYKQKSESDNALRTKCMKRVDAAHREIESRRDEINALEKIIVNLEKS
jgi:hypothetical protein